MVARWPKPCRREVCQFKDLIIMEEVFKDVVGFEDYFQISNLGNIFSKRSNRVLKTHIAKSGYVLLATKIGSRQGTNHCFRVHRLVAEAFLPNPENKPEVYHIDGIKTNNKISNLEWVTAEENMNHAKTLSLFKAAKGVLNSQSKLSIDDVLFIRKSSESSRYLATMFGVTHSTILRVKNGISYKDIL